MKPTLQFLRTTLVGGVLFLVPIIVLIVIFGKAIKVAHQLVDPLAEHLPVHPVIGLRAPMLLALGLIVLFCFLAGFLARTLVAQKMVKGLETAVLSNVPGYEFFKSVGEGLLGTKPTFAHQTVIARFDDVAQIGFLIERLENGSVAVFIPDAPNPYSGGVYLMASDRVTLVAALPAATMKCLKRLGAGSGLLLRDVFAKAETARNSAGI